MKSENNELLIIKNAVFTLLCQLESNLADHISKDKIDSQALFALTKLVDSFIKISHAETLLLPKDSTENKKDNLVGEDKGLLEMYKRMAPRAGLEPATERLTAACSTTELPGN